MVSERNHVQWKQVPNNHPKFQRVRCITVDYFTELTSSQDPVRLSRYVSFDIGRTQCLIAYYLKTICTGNILILRGNIEVLPDTRRTVSYEFLSQLVADYLLKTCPDVDVSAALSVMPLTQSVCYCFYSRVFADDLLCQRAWI